MRSIQRTISEVRDLRGDLSTWLVHLTKDNVFIDDQGRTKHWSAKNCLTQILVNNEITAVNPVGQFNYKKWYVNVAASDLRAVSFTETPLHEIFLFVGIKYKALKFSSYGLVFNREEIAQSPLYAAPVMYFSQPKGDNHFLRQFNKLEQQHCADYRNVLYLFDKFGTTYSGTDYNFMWEREWRIKGNLANLNRYIKFGLCPEADIPGFESAFPNLTFVDPFFNPKQIEARLRARGII